MREPACREQNSHTLAAPALSHQRSRRSPQVKAAGFIPAHMHALAHGGARGAG